MVCRRKTRPKTLVEGTDRRRSRRRQTPDQGYHRPPDTPPDNPGPETPRPFSVPWFPVSCTLTFTDQISLTTRTSDCPTNLRDMVNTSAGSLGVKGAYILTSRPRPDVKRVERSLKVCLHRLPPPFSTAVRRQEYSIHWGGSCP